MNSIQSLIKKFYYVYILLAILFSILFLIIKCIFHIKIFDEFLYIDDNNNNYIAFVSFHLILNYILGLIFGLDVYFEILLKIIIIEIILLFMKDCDYKSIFEHMDITIIAIFIGCFSYLFGALVRLLIF
jgi:hypothetical protein